MISTTQYLLTAFVAYLGLLAGLIVSLLSKEELKPGRKYFVLLQHSLFIIILLFSLHLHKASWALTIFLVVLIVFVLSFASKLNTSIVAYPVLGFIFFANQSTATVVYLTSALIFLYGLPTAALQIDTKEKNYAKVFLRNISFLIVALLMLYLT